MTAEVVLGISSHQNSSEDILNHNVNSVNKK